MSSMIPDKADAACKSRTHKQLRPHKQSLDWNVLALSHGSWKLPDDKSCAFLQRYMADLPHHLLGLVVNKRERFPYIINVD